MGWRVGHGQRLEEGTGETGCGDRERIKPLSGQVVKMVVVGGEEKEGHLPRQKFLAPPTIPHLPSIISFIPIHLLLGCASADVLRNDKNSKGAAGLWWWWCW